MSQGKRSSAALFFNNKMIFRLPSVLAFVKIFIVPLVGTGLCFQFSSLAFETAFHTDPSEGKWGDHMGLERFKMANPVQGVVSPTTHQSHV